MKNVTLVMAQNEFILLGRRTLKGIHKTRKNCRMNSHKPITKLQQLSTHGQSYFIYKQELPYPGPSPPIILKQIPDILAFHLYLLRKVSVKD